VVDITTRQQIELRGFTLESIPEIWEKLRGVDLHSLQTGIDNVRNINGGRYFDNRLLAQARREALEQELDHARLAATLAALSGQSFAVERPPRITPFAFPLWVQHLQGRLSNQPLEARVAHILAELERAADR